MKLLTKSLITMKISMHILGNISKKGVENFSLYNYSDFICDSIPIQLKIYQRIA